MDCYGDSLFANKNIPNTLESFTFKMPAAYNFIVTGVDGMNTYTIFNKGPYKGITC